MSQTRTVSEEREYLREKVSRPLFGSEGSHHWHHWGGSWKKPYSQSAAEPLDGYVWRTSAPLTPGKLPSKVAISEGKGQAAEPAHLRVLSLPRRVTSSIVPEQSDTWRQGRWEKARPLRGLIPFHRSLSEPGAHCRSEETALRKVGSDAAQNGPFVSGLFSSVSRRLGRILSIRDESESPLSGRGAL